MRHLFILLLSLFATSAMAAPADSVVVVKGQVSDYYISVDPIRTLQGTVTDAAGRPVEGATVMPLASPTHCNTDAAGHYAVTVGDWEKRLQVYAPGMEMAYLDIAPGATTMDIQLRPAAARPSLLRRKAEATPWYDAATYAPRTYCNPVNISYNYEPLNPNTERGGAFRSSADPMGLAYGDEYMLFSTNQGGFHYSKDLTQWDFEQATFQRRPKDDDQCAPAAWTVGDTLYYVGCTYEGLPVWYTTDPHSGRWRRAIERDVLPWWDPYFFLDDDGRLYAYYGSSNEYPLKGVEVSRQDFHPISRIYDVLRLQPKQHGWERFGMNNDDEVTLAPFTEGAYMTKHDGKYYLQYGAPGTEFKIYADGVYVSDSPLGPFTYQRHNPMSYKPGGYVQGSGHGGTFCDLHGNYWHFSTCMLSLKYKFERRIGLYPVGFDRDGVMYSSSAFGDYPNLNALTHTADDGQPVRPEDRFAGWMLLSGGKQAWMGRTAGHGSNGRDFHLQAAVLCEEAPELTDESMRTCHYIATTDSTDNYLNHRGTFGQESTDFALVDLGAEKTVRALQVNYYDHRSTQHNRANDIYYQYRIWASADGNDWTLVVDKSDADRDCPHDYVELQQPLRTRFVRLENIHMASGDFCLSGLRVFGLADGTAPATPKKLAVARDKQDPRNAMITWQPSAGAYAYNIYYGVAPDKLYNAITVVGDTSYDFRGLDLGTTYHFAIEALGESGRSPLSKIITK